MISVLREKKPNRRLVILGAVIIELCLGVIYAWPFFAQVLTDRAVKHGFTSSQVSAIFTAALITFTVAAFIAGRILEKAGPRKLLMAGGCALGLGYLLGGLFGGTFPAQLIFIGILAGAGAGTAYLIPPTLIVRWFPDMKGTALGITLAGYGSGAIVWSGLAGAFITFDLMGLGGIQTVYFLFAMIIFAGIAAGSILLTEAPREFMKPGSGMDTAVSGLVNYEYREMIRERQFYLLTGALFLFTLSSMTVMETIQDYGAYALKAKGLEAKIGVKVAQLAAFISQVMVAVGSVVWGFLSDYVERKLALTLMCFFQGIVVFLLYYMAGSPQSLILFSCLVGFNIGASLFLFLVVTGDYFGDRNIGVNYSCVFPAAGIAVTAAPQIVFYAQCTVMGAAQDPAVWTKLYLSAGAACLVGALATLMLKMPRKVS
jgi:MFS family permease